MKSTNSRHRYESELEKIRQASRWRFLRAWDGAGGVFTQGGTCYLNFSSNDYLNLSGDPALKAAVVDAVAEQGCGATASRLMSGNLTIHEALERALADLTGQERALVFPSGYQANVGVLTSLAGPDDMIFSDALNHASIIDGARLSKASIQVYRHNDVAHLESLLRSIGLRRAVAGVSPVHSSSPAQHRIIVTDSVFSMDGDLAPLKELAALAARYDAVLVVDEAHAIGIWGEGGGLCRHLGIRPDVTIGTLGKALGSGGGFAACDGPYRDLLINRARSFIYSTGVSPMNAAAALAAVEAIVSRKSLGPTLLRRARQFQSMLADHGIDVAPGETQIIPIAVGDDAQVMTLAKSLLEAGLIATGIRPPTVPEGTARLRLSVTLAHDDTTLEKAAGILARVLVE
ncbi:MAG: 8-amino-7-oxononanoate synthase [Candidatus Hydrogenedentes bacterium]|nr:8-amino-7-oxononanoate synthase [Candidatus Hydrogenedentota bacterium]